MPEAPPPPLQANVRDLRGGLARYLRQVAEGSTIEIVLKGKVVAELHPPAPALKPASTRGSLKGQFWFAPGWHEPSDELADLFEGSVI